MEILIKKPCHENWEAMAPNEQGAFCNKCVKTVIDFSSKSLEEIKGFFAGRQEEKICGRFEAQQLTALSFDAFFIQFKRFELNKRFALIVFFTFGFWLFGTSISAQTNAHQKGEVRIEEPKITGGISVKSQPKDTIKCVKPKPHNTKVIGKVAPAPQKKQVYLIGVIAAPTEEKKITPKK